MLQNPMFKTFQVQLKSANATVQKARWGSPFFRPGSPAFPQVFRKVGRAAVRIHLGAATTTPPPPP